MTPEQKQRIEQIRLARQCGSLPWSHLSSPSQIQGCAENTIDFLLSLVKSQEAEPFYMLFSPCTDGEHSDCIEYSNGLRRDGSLTRCSCPCHRPELPDQMERDAMIETISELERERDIAATSMRSACVEVAEKFRNRIQYESDEAVRESLFGDMVIEMETVREDKSRG